MRFRLALPLALTGAIVLATTPIQAQRQQTPEQRIGRLERQVRQVQRQVFPKGQPADTAGFSDDPAATQASVVALSGRLDAIERQMAEIVRASEENGNRLSVMEAEVARLRAEQDRRFRALENGAVAAGSGSGEAAAPADEFVAPTPRTTPQDGPPPAPQPRYENAAPATPPPAAIPAAAGDEAAYDAGFRLWEAKRYDDAIRSLNAMIAQYPNSRRVSWAQNLIGRSLLDKGQPRAAAEALLANYRRDPKGERAQDSLYYLGQSLMRLNQASQACKAYAELEEVYGSNVRPQLKSLLPAAKSQAKCS
ncbi:tetratricopeptide repeat protein [Sphingomonas rhizophila]|uniref:Tetratricopeptide repeat protein n=1 Tax=Sphingomonas rhizophila TaxID=2071607 RepID=A0A7G9S9L8_9SPHN|nr:tetratricopeptide repeat protein [Sphingomonas rhizophila]QNN64543.1 tetratricopeptide repeat protein [Sphingomonas rhizophila]